MVVGEAQIVAQMKAAYQQACEGGCTSVVFNRLFRHALEVGKRVRTETAIGERPVSVSSAAVELALQVFGKFKDHTVLIVGAGETSELTATHLKAHGIESILVTNRTLRRPREELAHRGRRPRRALRGPRRRTWRPPTSSSAPPRRRTTSSRASVVERALKHRRHRPIFFIDIAVPRDLDPEINRVRNAYLYDIDDLQHVVEQNRDEREKEAHHAERIVEEELASVNDWLRSLEVVPTIATLRETVEQIRQAELERLGSKLERPHRRAARPGGDAHRQHRQQDPAHADGEDEGGRRQRRVLPLRRRRAHALRPQRQRRRATAGEAATAPAARDRGATARPRRGRRDGAPAAVPAAMPPAADGASTAAAGATVHHLRGTGTEDA